MTTFTRRAMLAGTAAAATAAAQFGGTSPAAAAAPPANKQADGWYRYKVGSYELTAVTDGATRFRQPDNFVANKSRDEVNAAWTAMFMKADEMVIPYTPVVINTGSKLVVIDTGTGEANLERTKGASGQFQRNLKASGIDADKVDTVIITHFHGDHINGLLTADEKSAFPNAEILVPALEHQHVMDDAETAKQTTDRMKGIFANARKVFSAVSKQIRPYEADKELAPGMKSVSTLGHSRGHMSVMVSSGNDAVFVQGDVTNIPLFVRNPGWHLVFDENAQQAEATRRKVYDMLATDKVRVQGFHYPFPALAYIEKSQTGYREVPVAWSPTI